MFRFLVVSEDAKTVTRLLRAWQDGDETALDSLMPLIYTELHKIARRFMQQERAGHTLRPTALVSEAYLRLVEKEPPAANNRVHFCAIAARIMRQILVDSARSRRASKRGGGQRPLTLDETIAAVDRPEELVALDEALIALSKHYPRKAQAIELCYFGGLTHDEIALKLNVHPNTVARDLRLGEALLRTYLTAEGD